MTGTSDRAGAVSSSRIPVLDLNDLLLEHPAASFVFRCVVPLSPECGEGDIIIVDRAHHPDDGCLVLIEHADGFSIETYQHQVVWGVVTYLLHKTT